MFVVNVSGGENLNLQQFLSLVEKHNKDIKLAEKEKSIAKANKKEAISTALPKIFAQADYKRNLKDYYMYADMSALMPDMDMGISKFKVNRKNEYSFNAVLTQTLFSPTVGNALKAAKQYRKLTDFAYDAGYQTIISYAKKAFYQTLLLEKLWKVAKSAEKNAHENFLNVKLKFDNGVVSQFELLQAEVRWKTIIPETAKAKRNYELSLNNLKNWAGIQVQDEISLKGDFDKYPALPEIVPLETILTRRPDYNALLWEEKLRGTNVSAKRSAYFPTLTGSFIYFFDSKSDYFQLDERNVNYIAGINFSIPIFTGGYTGAQVQKAKIELDKTRIKIDKTKENIYNEIRNINLRLHEAYERINSAETILKTAKKAFHIAETTANSGLATQLELKDTRVAFDQARINYYAAIYDYLDAYFDWERANGMIRVANVD